MNESRLAAGGSRGYHARMIEWLVGVRRGIRRLAMAGGDLLFPPRCILCDVETHECRGEFSFCADCLCRLAPQVWLGCWRCWSPSDGAAECLQCRAKPPAFDAVVPLGVYQSQLREAVLRMKRPTSNALSERIGQMLAQWRAESLAAIAADVIVPIPMFWRRRLRRGTNSPDILARCLSRSLRIPVRRGALVRRVNTAPQAGLSPDARRKNVRKAFRVRRPQAIEGVRVLLVDDILTTGATCGEAARMLKRAGASMVAVAVAARTFDHASVLP